MLNLGKTPEEMKKLQVRLFNTYFWFVLFQWSVSLPSR